MIPRILHLVWIGDAPMPPWAERNLDAFRRLNPDYDIRIHGEEVLLDRYRAVYDRITELCSRADLLRYSALQRYGGGFYFDVDYWPMRPLDDIVRAWNLDGRTMFITEQNGHMNPKLTHNNGVLAATAECPAWTEINAAVDHAATGPLGRCTFGPVLMTELQKRSPGLFTVGEWPWFYPAGPGRAGRLYSVCADGRQDYMRRVAPTGGQYPFAMHLWAGGKSEIRQSSPDMIAHLPPTTSDGPWAGLRVAFPMIEAQWRDQTQCFRSICEGLAAIGCDVEVRKLHDDDPLETADLCVNWNGRKGHYRRIADMARKRGTPTLHVEHGFFDRRECVQIDHAGILHWASWRDQLATPAPADGARRLARVWPHDLKPFRKRKGYVLVLGQIKGDAQLIESEIREPTPLDKMLHRSLERHGLEGRFRPHPRSPDALAREIPPHFCPRNPGSTLEEDIAGARFAVTINSNAGNECLALGCPVLCFGPALYAQGGVALQTPQTDFQKNLKIMVDGWRPATAVVRNYLHWLACRQWNQAELRQGDVLADLIGRAMA
ncbi:MAG TPA: glycosyltransferase [Phycisphaerae bacterium]|nr:glycosyltransferase [Phycisphaerae bacterium]